MRTLRTHLYNTPQNHDQPLHPHTHALLPLTHFFSFIKCACPLGLFVDKPVVGLVVVIFSVCITSYSLNAFPSSPMTSTLPHHPCAHPSHRASPTHHHFLIMPRVDDFTYPLTYTTLPSPGIVTKIPCCCDFLSFIAVLTLRIEVAQQNAYLWRRADWWRRHM